ncbi:hypothetical protein [Paractinoplanes toevensis]|uniref:Uncharacterized protein n=1 Tax=Paractinoplanes toevensis TaxID=571911 RepID=A0A919TFV5_9ACTN|nr:hypothetical protein [Actinoplanes toevensis]GIM94392.1 hypothetical protein Ato02nite_061850 [Actinoplanes toevensis]
MPVAVGVVLAVQLHGSRVCPVWCRCLRRAKVAVIVPIIATTIVIMSSAMPVGSGPGPVTVVVAVAATAKASRRHAVRTARRIVRVGVVAADYSGQRRCGGEIAWQAQQ